MYFRIDLHYYHHHSYTSPQLASDGARAVDGVVACRALSALAARCHVVKQGAPFMPSHRFCLIRLRAPCVSYRLCVLMQTRTLLFVSVEAGLRLPQQTCVWVSICTALQSSSLQNTSRKDLLALGPRCEIETRFVDRSALGIASSKHSSQRLRFFFFPATALNP